MNDTDRQKYLQLVTRKLVSLTATCMLILLIIFYVIKLNELEKTYLVSYVFLAGLIGGL
jgi:hypothetical protein